MYDKLIDDVFHFEEDKNYKMVVSSVLFNEGRTGRKYCRIQFQSVDYTDCSFALYIHGITYGDSVNVRVFFEKQRKRYLNLLHIDNVENLEGLLNKHYLINFRYTKDTYEIKTIKEFF